MKKKFNFLFTCFICASVIFFTSKGVMVMRQQDAKTEKEVIVIDAGHGGKDPGKVGVNGVNEKDVNLNIALKLKIFLEQSDFEVIMIRTDDRGLYSDSDTNKKRVDLRNRVNIINNSGAVLAVSVHQNSFSQGSSRGAQVFYHTKSLEGKELACVLQNQIKETIGDDNHRVAKSNDSYYMLKQTQCPLVIVECGFLSNAEEAKLLCEEAYQEKMAWAIHMGISNYLNSKK